MHTHGKAHKYLEKCNVELKTFRSTLLLHKLTFWFAKLCPQQLPHYFCVQTHGESLFKQ